MKLTHNERCANAREPKKYCRCSCHGSLHRQDGEAREEMFATPMTEAMGGEVAEFIKANKGRMYECFGVCRSHGIADIFLGYEHDGGLADATGKKWWVYVRCYNKLPPSWGKRLCNYETSFSHLPRRIEAERRKAEERMKV